MMLLAMTDGMTKLLILLGYMSLLLFLGFGASRLFRGTKNDYLLASHSIGPFLLLMSLFGTTMTAFALVGSSGRSYNEGIGVYGMLASGSGIIHSLCFFVIGIKIYRFGRQHGYATQIQFFRDRLESDLVGLLLFPILVGLIIPYLMIGVVGAGVVISVTTGGAFPDWSLSADGSLPPWLGALIVCAVVLVYVFFGGMRGTAWANAFQTTVFMVLGVVAFVMLANRMGEGETFMESVRNLNEKLSVSKSTRSAMSQTLFFTYLFIPLSIGMFPHLFQHWLTARSSQTFKLPIVMHPIFIMIVWVPCVLIGVWGTVDNLGLSSNEANKVLPILVNKHIGPVVGGLLSAGILAAIMSSLDSQFLCIGSMFTNDIVTHYAGKERFSDGTQIWIARGFVVLIVAVTYGLCLATDFKKDVFSMAIWCFSGFSGLFPIVFAALYWRRLTSAGVLSGTLAAFGSWLYLFRQSMWGSNKGFAITIFGDHLPIMPVVMIFFCTLVAMVLTTFLTRPPSESTLRKFFPTASK